MELTLRINGTDYGVRLDKAHDISIPVRFGEDQLRAFGGPPASSEAYITDGFTGSVAKGGSCNCEYYSFSPHLNGTHSECVGHISKDRINIHDAVSDSLVPALVVTVVPEKAADTTDSYDPAPRPDDRVITLKALEDALSGHDKGFSAALVVRTAPNDTDKQTRNYFETPPPYFSMEAISHITGTGVRHLLVDMPSIDRPDDDGLLSNHHIFWGVAHGGHDVAKQDASSRSITELVYVPDDVKDGPYLLNLQIAAFEGDAAPSRPVLYEVTAT